MTKITRRGFVRATSAFALSAPALIGLSRSAQAATTIRIGAGHPPASAPIGAYAEFFVPELKKRAEEAGHPVNIIEAWSGTVAKATEVFPFTRDGLLDIGLVAPTFEPSRLGLFNYAYIMPFGSADLDIANKVAQSMLTDVPELNESIAGMGTRAIGLSISEDYGMILRNRADTLGDLQGRRIASGASNTPWSEAAGAIGLALPLGEHYTALQTGLADGSIYTFAGMIAYRLNEVADGFLETGFGCPATVATVANLRFMDGLPDPVRTLVEDLARETSDYLKVRNQERLKKTLASDGDLIWKLPVEDRAEWAKKIEPTVQAAVQRMENEGIPAAKVFNRYIELQQAAGHEFAHVYAI